MNLHDTACDKCTAGVMDQNNPHLHGLCKCECHRYPFTGLKARIYVSKETMARLRDAAALEELEHAANREFLRLLGESVDREALGLEKP